jgi:hypothetical protein
MKSRKLGKHGGRESWREIEIERETKKNAGDRARKMAGTEKKEVAAAGKEKELERQWEEEEEETR